LPDAPPAGFDLQKANDSDGPDAREAASGVCNNSANDLGASLPSEIGA
jgi:hypothetical protein